MSRRYYWIAADQDQGALAIDAIAGFVQRTPTLADRVEVQARRVLVPSNGASLDVLAADAQGAWGLRPAGVFADELANWAETPLPRRLWEAVSTAVAKAGSTGDAGSEGPSPRDVLAELRIEDGRRWIDAATVWQLADALAVIEGELPYHYLTRARGASKTCDLAACALALLLAGVERPGALLVVLTTAGDPAHFSRRILDHAYDSPLWRVNEVPGPPPWADLERLAEQRARLTESAYARLFENRWTEAEDRLTTIEAVRECATLGGPLDHEREREPYAIGLDLGLKRDRTVAAVCHREGARVVLDRMGVWSGSRLKPVRIESVETWLEQAARSYGGARILLDPWQTVGTAQRLRGRGLQVEEFAFTAQSVGRLAGTLYGLLRDRNLALPDDDELIAELAHVRLRETSPGVFKMENDPARHDDRAVALALAATELLREPQYGNPVSTKHHPFGGRRDVPLHPVHDDSDAHRRWADWRWREHGERCPGCETEFARREAAHAAREAAEAAPRTVGKFLIHPHNPKGGRR